LANKLFDIDVQVAQLPGGSKTRQLIVDTGLEYLRRVSGGVRVDPGLALELGTAYMRVARVQGVNISPNLGQTAQAEKSAQTAQGLIDSVLAAQPKNRIALLRAGQIAHDRMILAAAAGRTDESLRFAATSIERLDQFLGTRQLDASSDHMDAQQVIIAFMNVAQQYLRVRRFDEANRTAYRAIDLANATNWQPQAGAAFMIVAMAHRELGELDQALQAIRESVRLLEPAPGETRVGRLNPYGLALIREGEILGQDGAISLDRPEEAVEFMNRGLRMGEDLARRDSSDYSAQCRVFFTEIKIAGIVRHKDPARALALYDDALQRLAGATGHASTLHDETEALAASVGPLLQLGRRAEARERLDAALDRLERLKQYPAGRIDLESPAQATLSAAADYEAAAGRLKEAARRYEELLRLVEAAAKPEDSLADAVRVSNLSSAAARIERKAGRDEVAAALEQRRTKLWQTWNAKLPNNPFVRRQLESSAHEITLRHYGTYVRRNLAAVLDTIAGCSLSSGSSQTSPRRNPSLPIMPSPSRQIQSWHFSGAGTISSPGVIVSNSVTKCFERTSSSHPGAIDSGSAAPG